MKDITSGLISLSGIVLFSQYLLPGLKRSARLAIAVPAFAAMVFVFARKYAFAQPVKAQVGPALELLINLGFPITLILVCGLVVWKQPRQAGPR